MKKVVPNKVVVVPCSGIGKAFGSVAREAGYELCETLRPDATELVALSKLVLGEETAKNLVQTCPTITIDGCKLGCACKLVELNGGSILRAAEVLDTFRRHKELKPDGIAELNAEGKQLARVLAEELAQVVDVQVVDAQGCQCCKGEENA